MITTKAIRDFATHPLMLPFFMPSLLNAFARGMMVPILPLYAADFEISYGLIGIVLAMEMIGLMIFDVPAGVLIHRFGMKRVLVIGMLILILTTASLFWAQSVLLVIILRFIGGGGLALYNVALHTYIAQRISLERRGRAIATFGGIHRAGNFAGPAVAGVIASIYGLRSTFLVYAVVSLMAFALYYLFLHNIVVKQKHGVPPIQHAGVFTVLRTHYRVLTTAGLGQLFAQMIRQGRAVIIPLYGADILGLNTQDIGFIISISSAIDMVLFYPAGWIMDNLGRKWAVVPSFIGQAIGMMLIPFSINAGGLLFASSLMGFSNGFSAGSMMTIGSDLAPEESRGEMLGVWRLIGDTGSSGAPIIVGAVADALALQPAAWAMAGAGLLAAGMFGVFVPETLKKKRKAKPEPA